MIRYIESRGFWFYCGVLLTLLLFFRLYRGYVGIERGTGRIILFQEKAA